MLKLKVGVLGLLFFLSLLVGGLAPTFTTSIANAHVENSRPAPFRLLGDHLNVNRYGRTCVYTVSFDVSRYHRPHAVRVTGPRDTRPTLRGAVIRRGWMIITYNRTNIHHGRCERDRYHYPRQFTLHLVR